VQSKFTHTHGSVKKPNRKKTPYKMEICGKKNTGTSGKESDRKRPATIREN